MERTYILEKQIEYLAQLQEREKFNYNIRFNGFFQTIAIAVSLVIALSAIILAVFINYNKILIGIWVVVVLFIILLIIVMDNYRGVIDDIDKIKNNFRRRQMRIKNKYINLIGREEINQLR